MQEKYVVARVIQYLTNLAIFFAYKTNLNLPLSQLEALYEHKSASYNCFLAENEVRATCRGT